MRSAASAFCCSTRNARRDHLLAHAPLPQGVPLDERVIEEPKWKWWPILNLIILSVRPSRKGRDYATIWNNELDEGPLKTITRSQADKLAERLSEHPKVIVDWAMRYANPSTESRIRELQKQGCERILLVPLYPQYAAATTATACDQAFRALIEDALAAFRSRRASLPRRSRLHRSARKIDEGQPRSTRLRSREDCRHFHGMPQKYFDRGDPYHCHCQKTSRLLREALGWPAENWLTTFQSRFGNDPWLQPYTDMTVERLAKEGVKKLALVAPGFSADCLETLEELDGENRHIFEDNGGEKFAYLPALNDSDEGVDVIEAIVRRELAGWI